MLLINNDMREALKSLADNSIDTCITDCPYELGFMQKSWDKTGVSFDPNTWKEVSRVLKPGGYLLAFGGSKTFHRIACAIEDAELELKDTLMYMYGCVDKDTEILINGHWKKFDQVKIGDKTIAYDIKSQSFKESYIEDFFEYQYNDTAYHIISNNTDQLVSKNHKCVVKINEQYEFKYAENLYKKQKILVPILERVPALQETICMSQPQSSSKQQALFDKVCDSMESQYTKSKKREYKLHSSKSEIHYTRCKNLFDLRTRICMSNKRGTKAKTNMLVKMRKETSVQEPQNNKQKEKISNTKTVQVLRSRFCMQLQSRIRTKELLLNKMQDKIFKKPTKEATTKKAFRRTVWNDTCHMYKLQQNILDNDMACQKHQTNNLFTTLQWSFKKQRAYKTFQERRSRCKKARTKGGCEKANDRLQQPFMERRRYIQAIQRELQRSKICQVPVRLQRYVAQKRICSRTSNSNSRTLRKMLNTARVRPPHQSYSVRQSFKKPNVIFNSKRSQEFRTLWSTTTDLATITPEHYKGVMWCITVDTGAFVARRNGKIFITGNSGMPKGLNISKGIDKHFGKEQKVVGSKLGMPGYSLKENDTKDHERKVYGQFTDAEKECAITEPNTELAQAFVGYNTTLKPCWEPIIMAMKPLDGTYAENAIKWNLAGLNIDDCRISTKDNLNGGAYAKNGTPRDDGWGMQRGGAGEFKQPSGRWPANVILEHTPECTDECSPNCPVFILNQQSGILSSGTGAVKKSSGTGYQGNALGKESRPVGTPNVEYGDSGGASRFFYCSKASKKERNAGLNGIVNDHTTVKPIELMQYLCKLTMPPHKGIVLDPFMGSGSTGVAAVMTGRDFIGIELDKHYFEIAEQRIKHAQGKTNEQI